MAVKFISSWPINANEALVNFQFMEDRGANAQVKVTLDRGVLQLDEKSQALEAEKRFREIHVADLVTDERIQTQGEMVEVTSRALMELSMILFQVQQQISGLDRRIDALGDPEEHEGPEEEQTQDEDSDNKN